MPAAKSDENPEQEQSWWGGQPAAGFLAGGTRRNAGPRPGKAAPQEMTFNGAGPRQAMPAPSRLRVGNVLQTLRGVAPIPALASRGNTAGLRIVISERKGMSADG